MHIYTCICNKKYTANPYFIQFYNTVCDLISREVRKLPF